MVFPSESVYDGCMTILLNNGSIVAQSGVRTKKRTQELTTKLGTLVYTYAWVLVVSSSNTFLGEVVLFSV